MRKHDSNLLLQVNSYYELASKTRVRTELLGDHSDCDPPDPIPNSEVKPISADGSVGFPHVRVGHRQALYLKAPAVIAAGAFSPLGCRFKIFY